MHKSRNSIIIVVILLITSIFILLPFYWLKHKPVHVSIDDVEICLRDLQDNDEQYLSVFQQPFLSNLRRLHQQTGAKFTLYTYECSGNYHVSKIPKRFIHEIRENADWLRFGFHAKEPEFIKDSVTRLEYFKEAYASLESSKLVVCGGGNLRLHYYYATPEEVAFLKEKGVKVLLSADDDRISYSLPQNINKLLLQKENIIYNGMTYERTDIRIEKTWCPIIDLLKNRNDEMIVVFTHEWAQQQQKVNRLKFLFTLYFLSLYKANFIF